MQGDPKDEYLEVGQNMRQFGNIRFAQITLFVGMNAGILAGLSQSGAGLSDTTRIFLKIGAIIVTILFWILDQRAMDYWHHFRRRSIELEKVLGFEQYTKAPVTNVLNATNAIRVLYLVLLVFWITALIWHSRF
jgi:hypothetical protein